PFTLAGAPTTGTALEPGQSITVQVAFRPTSPGGYTGSFGLTTQAGEASVSLSGTAPSPPLASTSISILTAPGAGAPLSGPTASRILLEHLKLRFLAGKSSRHKRKGTVTYTLSSAAKVRLIIYRRTVSHHCASGAHTCARYLPTAIRLTVSGRAGPDRVTLDLTTLARGDYRLSATPLVGAGVQTTTRHFAFVVG
ncbi:MAG TPA: hypothetical protein VGO14_09890, partial [Solirubrobacteraceae bacterium]|nr:hypothetical protein [Solirubrobacteraceae bacterium]